MTLSPSATLLMLLWLPIIVTVAVAIGAQMLWKQYKRRRRSGFPVEPHRPGDGRP